MASRSALPLLLLLAASLVALRARAQDARPPAEATVQLLLSGTTDAVRIREAWSRPWPYVAQRHETEPAGRIELRDGGGRLLYEVPFVVETWNLHRDARRGLVLVEGDRVQEPRIEALVKIPDFGPALATLRIEVIEDTGRRVLAELPAAELRRVLTSTAIHQPLAAPVVKTLLNNGPVANRYDIVILGDGYQASEEARFYADIDKWRKDLFGREPYQSYAQFFNIHSVFRASVESGADHPDVSPPIVKNTAYDATYNYGNTARCLYIRNGSLATSDAALAPDVEGRIVVFVNDSRYGGCAGTFAVSYNGSSGPVVQSHEFGHSFGRLADEYDYGRSGTYSGPEPSQANITADPTGKAKWPLWLGYNGIGAFQGAGYYKTGLYRPKSNCLMRALSAPLCEVCVEQLCKQGYVTVNPLENPFPASPFVNLSRPDTQRFQVDDLVPGGAELQWFVDNTLVQDGGSTFVFASAAYPLGARNVVVRSKDKTAFVRSDPSRLLETQLAWSVNVQQGSATSLGTAPLGYDNREGNTRHHPVFVNSSGRVQYFYRRNRLPQAGPSRTLQGLRVRPDGAAGTGYWAADLEIRLSSVQLPIDALTTSAFAANHGNDVRVAFARRRVDWPAVPAVTQAPHPFVQSLKFDAAQMLTGADLCIDLLGWSQGIEVHDWFADAERAEDLGSKTVYGTGCPATSTYDSAGHYVGGRWRTWGYTRQQPSSTSYALAWLGDQRSNVPLPGTSCTVLAPALAFYAQPVVITTGDGYANFDWGRVPFGLRNAKLTSQMLGIDLGYNAFGLRLTPAVEVRIGTGHDYHAVYGYALGTTGFDPLTSQPQYLALGTAAIFELY